jgi:hypothetical protein
MTCRGKLRAVGYLDRLKSAARRHPLETTLVLVATLATLYVVVFPFTVTRYVPMTDLPFHAASTGILRHYFDPERHLREQFVFLPIAAPYMSTYVIGALLMLVMPSWMAVKVTAAIMLALLPVGLAVMFHGMKKSPLLGLAGLPFVWNFLTHWGFLNYVGAIGLFCLAIGLTLLLLDKPSFRRQWQLSAVLVLLFFTHIFRFPFALLGVVGTAIVMYPATRRFWPIAPPLVVPAALFVAWLGNRTETQRTPLKLVALDALRLGEFKSYLLEGGFQDAEEAAAILTGYRVLGVVAVVLFLIVLVDGRLERRTKREWAFRFGVALVTLGCAGAFFLLFLKLPMEAGLWWYIYPRETIAATVLALGFLPDLPRRAFLRLPIVLALAAAPLGIAHSISTNYRAFDRATDDFHRISQSIPVGPKLMYLIFYHSGSRKKNTPFIHLPAYIQAEKGGWLGFHFATFYATPPLYRDRNEPGALIPPPVPLRWEWTPQRFRPLEHGRFFNWFLVRNPQSPAGIFRADPSIVQVERVGSWWLYKRTDASARSN